MHNDKLASHGLSCVKVNCKSKVHKINIILILNVVCIDINHCSTYNLYCSVSYLEVMNIMLSVVNQGQWSKRSLTFIKVLS